MGSRRSDVLASAALDLDPDRASALNNLAYALATLVVAYRAAGREAEAEAALDRAAELRGATE